MSYTKEIAAKCGIKIEERVFPKGLDVMQAIVAGEIDVGATASEAVISARASGVPIYVVGGFAKGGARLVGRSDLNLKKIADLKGKKVGVTRGSIQEVLLVATLSKAGLTWSDQANKDVQILYLGFPDLNQALQTKNIDAMMQSEPYSSQAINKNYGSEMLKPYDTPIGEPVRTLVMTEKFYKERRPVAQKFMQCFVESTKLFMDKPEFAEKYVKEVMFKNQITADDFQDAIGNSPYSMDITAEHIQATTDVMYELKIGKMSNKPVANDWVRLDLLEQAKKTVLR
jgi:NitT/TauT family transport system substrate-binding protein